jgi:hypothetical protein
VSDGPEIALTGGRITPGVVRVGDTVRRPAKRGAVDLEALLGLLAARGFDGAPRYLGIDAAGRVMLSFLEGEVPGDLGHFEDDQLEAAARLLRRFHDATAGSPLVPGNFEVVCHNDFGPPNAVFRGKLPWAMIDFDTAAPGTRLWDLGYSAFSWLDLGSPDYSGTEQIRRLKLFTAAYEHPACPPELVAVHAVARQTSLAAHGRRTGDAAMADWAAVCGAWTAEQVLEAMLPTGLPGTGR